MPREELEVDRKDVRLAVCDPKRDTGPDGIHSRPSETVSDHAGRHGDFARDGQAVDGALKLGEDPARRRVVNGSKAPRGSPTAEIVRGEVELHSVAGKHWAVLGKKPCSARGDGCTFAATNRVYAAPLGIRDGTAQPTSSRPDIPSRSTCVACRNGERL